MPGQFEVMIERNFSSAHQLRGYKGKCENLHGHNYKIEIYARGSELNNIGLLVDFVELKLLRSLQPVLNGEIRKLLLVRGFQELRKDWRAAEAFVLEVLPRELIFLYPRIFDCERSELFAWLINIGHGLASDLLKDLQTRPVNGSLSWIRVPIARRSCTMTPAGRRYRSTP